MCKIFLLFFAVTAFGISDTKTYIKNYHSNGNLKEEGWLINDKKTDYWFYYYESGFKKEEGHYKNNQKTNWWIFYDENQQIAKKCEFKNNKLNGLTIVYKNGAIAKAEKYSNGKKIKTWTDLAAFRKDNNYLLYKLKKDIPHRNIEKKSWIDNFLFHNAMITFKSETPFEF